MLVLFVIYDTDYLRQMMNKKEQLKEIVWLDTWSQLLWSFDFLSIFNFQFWSARKYTYFIDNHKLNIILKMRYRRLTLKCHLLSWWIIYSYRLVLRALTLTFVCRFQNLVCSRWVLQGTFSQWIYAAYRKLHKWTFTKTSR